MLACWPSGEASAKEVVGIDVHEFWGVDDGAEDAQALPSHIDFLRTKARISWYTMVHRKTSTHHGSSSTSLFGSSHIVFTRHWSIRPQSTFHTVWTLLALLFIAYDVFSLPLAISFDIDGALFTNLNLTGSVFWTTDIVLNFVTGFYQSGALELRLPEIARHYLRRWFLLDASVVCVDWIFTFLVLGSKGAGVVRLAKIPRFVRVMKVFKVFEQGTDILVSHFAGAVSDNLRFLFLIVAFTHYVACGWHFIGVWQQRYGASWLDHEDLEGMGVLYYYAVSFQWSLSQFTPGANPYNPQNLAEWMYTNVVLFFGLAIYSSFLGGITSSLTCLRTETLQRYRQEKQLRDYLHLNRVGKELIQRIRAVGRHRYVGSKTAPTFSDIASFGNFPRSLLAEIKWSVRGPCVRSHPLFDGIMSSSPGALYKICNEAVSEISCSWGDEVFHVGSPAEHMLFVKRGCLEYVTKQATELLNYLDSQSPGLFTPKRGPAMLQTLTKRRSSVEEEPALAGVSRGSLVIRAHPHADAPYPWICEVALWLVWTHHGTLIARDSCTVLALQPKALYAAAAADVPLLKAFRDYAQAFANELGELVLRSDQDNYIDVVNDYWGGEHAEELTKQAVATVHDELSRIERHMSQSFSRAAWPMASVLSGASSVLSGSMSPTPRRARSRSVLGGRRFSGSTGT